MLSTFGGKLMITGIIIGLLIGWHVPQPNWVKNAIAAIRKRIGF